MVTTHRQLAFVGTLLLLAGTGEASASPSEFLTKAIKGDNSEAKLGALAATRGQSGQVRAFGRMLETDHQSARKKTIPTATRHHVPVPSEMAPEAKA